MPYFQAQENRNRYTVECWLQGEEGCTGYHKADIRTERKARRLHWRHNVQQHPQRTRAAWAQRMAEGQSS
jgi:hypothetical protein